MHKNIQIYKAAKGCSIGPKADQYRDCVDLAVKLAFGLEEMKWVRLESQPNIEKLEVVKSITNTTLDETIIVKDAVARVKQASDIKTVKAFYNVQVNVEKMLNMLSIESEELSDKYKKEYIKLIKDCNSYNELLTKMIKFDHLCIEEIKSSLDESYTQLSGMVQEIKDIDI